jgi:hypothetical protein
MAVLLVAHHDRFGRVRLGEQRVAVDDVALARVGEHAQEAFEARVKARIGLDVGHARTSGSVTPNTPDDTTSRLVLRERIQGIAHRHRRVGVLSLDVHLDLEGEVTR